MIDMTYLELICHSMDELPHAVREEYSQDVLARLDGSHKSMFPELDLLMPFTFGAIANIYRAPVIGTRTTTRGEAIATLIMEGEKTNIVANIHLRTHKEFTKEIYWLPRRLRAWYVATDGLQLVPNIEPPTPRTSGYGLPVPYAGRETAASYCSMHGYKKIAAKPMHQALECSQAYAWIMLKEGKQAVFTDKEHTGGNLYHVFGDDFKNFYELPNPENTIDSYCAHVIAGGEPEHFDFRA
jgi:hypothetical protein